MACSRDFHMTDTNSNGLLVVDKNEAYKGLQGHTRLEGDYARNNSNNVLKNRPAKSCELLRKDSVDDRRNAIDAKINEPLVNKNNDKKAERAENISKNYSQPIKSKVNYSGGNSDKINFQMRTCSYDNYESYKDSKCGSTLKAGYTSVIKDTQMVHQGR